MAIITGCRVRGCVRHLLAGCGRQDIGDGAADFMRGIRDIGDVTLDFMAGLTTDSDMAAWDSGADIGAAEDFFTTAP